MKKLLVSSQFSSLFILYISTGKPFCLLVRGYIEVKINKHEIWQALTQLTFEMSEIYQGNFQSSCRLAQLFLDIFTVILQKKSEIVGENFFQL